MSRQEYHLTQPCPSEEKQTKNSAQSSPYRKLIQTTGPTLGGQKPKGRRNSTFFKERIQLSLKTGKVQFSRLFVSDSVTPWIAARQASLSITNSWSSLILTSIESVMPSSHFILCRPLLLLPPIPPSLGGQKTKGKKSSTFFKERIQLSLKTGKRKPQTQEVKKKNEKAEKYYTHEGTN